MTRKLRIGVALGYALATFLSFPHVVGGAVVDLGIWVSWLAPALLLVALDDLPPARAARLAAGIGLVAHAAILHWIYVVTVSYGHAPVVVGIIAPVLLATYAALFTGLFGAVFAWLRVRGAASPFAVALLWTALEHARSFALSGWPWSTLGYAQHQSPWLLGLAPLTGVYGLSFTTALGGAALAALVLAIRGRKPIPRSVYAAAAVVVLLHLVGALFVPDPLDAATQRVRVAGLQGNIDQGRKWSPEWAERTLQIYEDLSRRAAGDGAQVILWPETAVPGAVDADRDLSDRLARLARETRATLIVGGVGLEVLEGDDHYSYFDSAFVIDPSGRFVERYDKAHLVPFGEYVPLRDLLGHFVKAVARGIARDDVTPGRGPRAVPVILAEGQPQAPEPLLVGIPICYELLFPDLMRRFAGDGAGVLFALTNDAWYGRTGAPYQFLAMTALRSAESGVWTVRAANTGVSAVIDARGRVRQETAIFERGFVVADVPLPSPDRRATFYVRHGDVFALACWAGAVALVLHAWRRSRRGRGR